MEEFILFLIKQKMLLLRNIDIVLISLLNTYTVSCSFLVV